VPPAAGPSDAGAPDGQALPGQLDLSELDGAMYDPDLFLRTVVEPSQAYVGQQVVMTVYLYTTLNLSNVNVTREPSTDGFWAEDLLGPARRLGWEQDQFVGSTRFRVAVLRRVALFPLREGALTVGPPELEASTLFSSFFSTRGGSVSRRGVDVNVRVLALPTKDRPDGFEPGNVGRFTIESRVDRTAVKVGEPVTLTVTVRGDGNLRGVKIRPLPAIEGARVYEPQIRDSVAPVGSSVVSGVRSWEYLVLPQKTGPIVLPPAELVSFDPVGERYRREKTEPLTVQVTGGEATAGPGPGVSEEQGSAEGEALADLRSIHRRSRLASGRSPLHRAWWFILVFAATPVSYVTVAVLAGVRRRRVASRDAIRARKAAGVARRALRAIKSDEGEGLAEVSRSLTRFLADRFGEPASGLTRDELRRFLLDRGVGEDVVDRFARMLEECEQRRYSPSGAAGALALAREAIRVIAELDDREKGAAR
jgi:hypothetical protein